MAPRDLARQDPADGAVDVAHRDRPEPHGLAALERRCAAADELPVERVVEHRAPAGRVRPRGASAGRSGAFSTIDRSTRRAFQCSIASSMSSSSVRPIMSWTRRTPSEAMIWRTSSAIKHQVVDDVLRRAAEAISQLRILRRDPHRTGVQVADAHHDAAHRDQRRGREAELVGPEQRPDHDVAPGLHLAVDLDRDPRAQVIEHQRLLGLGQADLPRHAGRLDRGLRRGAGAAVVTGDRHVVGVGLRDARGDRADPDLGDELDRDRAGRVRAAQVVDQLLEVLDRVDVVVRRRRDEADARGRVADLRDVVVDLVARKLPALAGLGALGHLDLQLVGVDEVVDRHAEAPGGDLLDRRAAQVAVVIGRVARGVLAPLAGVRPGAQPVHRDRQRLVRLAARARRGSSRPS